MSAVAELSPEVAPQPEPLPNLQPALAPACATWWEPLLVAILIQATCIATMYAGAARYPTRLAFKRENVYAGNVKDLPRFYREYAAHQAQHGKKPMLGLALGGSDAWLSPLVRWDSFWLLSVAEVGYVADLSLPIQQNVVYFPLYPLSIRALSLTGLSKPLAAVILANLCTLLTACLLFRLAARQFGVPSARWVLWLWLGYPTALFGTVAYSDSMLTLASVMALSAVLKDQPFRAGFAAGIATACRAPGLSLACLLVPGVVTRKWWQYVLSLPLSVAGIVGYFAWLGWQFGDPLLYPKIIRAWRPTDNMHPLRLIKAILTGCVHAVGLIAHGGERLAVCAIQIADPVLLLWSLAWIPAVRRLGWGATLYTVAAVGLALSAGGLMSFGRYSWAILPLFLVSGDTLSRSAWRWPIVIAFLAAQAWLAFLFGGGWEVI